MSAIIHQEFHKASWHPPRLILLEEELTFSGSDRLLEFSHGFAELEGY